MIPASEWIWHGHPLHLSVHRRCQFRMGTEIGDFVVSTIGEYELEGGGYDTLGIDPHSFYETMVFRKTGHFEGILPDRRGADTLSGTKCCPDITGDDLFCERYSNSVSARVGHMLTCQRVAAGEFS